MEKLDRKILYEFRKFAIKGGFWELYKKRSKPLNRGIEFKTLVEQSEPNSLIQSVEVFCGWPSQETVDWIARSKAWNEICHKKHFVHREWRMEELSRSIKAINPEYYLGIHGKNEKDYEEYYKKLLDYE